MEIVTRKARGIWPDDPTAYAKDYPDPLSIDTVFRGSVRAGGNYVITKDADDMLNRETDPYDDRVRARLTTMLIKMRNQGEPWPWVTPALVAKAAKAPDMPVHERADRLLSYIGRSCDSVAGLFHLLDEAQCSEAMALTESANVIELLYFWNYLYDRGWIDQYDAGYPRESFCKITIPGHARIAELTTRTESAQAFVAMWFDDSMNEVYEDAIRPAIVAAGYDPFRIDRHDFAGKIDDEIIAQIRQSRFLVADFTHQLSATVRGSVYYEAGFAHGLNIPVIFTAHKGSDLHFDTAHFNHLLWTSDDLPKLKEGLRHRILRLAELGRGPRFTGM